MKKMNNASHIEGKLYEADLQVRESGPNSKKPGTKFIMGTVSVATDDAMTNIVPIHYTYVTEKTSKNTDDARWKVLKDIIDGKTKTVMSDGADAAAMVRIDSAIDLNEFYSDRNGVEELVSVKRNEGGFIHLTNQISADEKQRNTFDCDMVITSARRVEANEERNLPEKMIIKGAIGANISHKLSSFTAGAMTPKTGISVLFSMTSLLLESEVLQPMIRTLG